MRKRMEEKAWREEGREGGHEEGRKGRKEGGREVGRKGTYH